MRRLLWLVVLASGCRCAGDPVPEGAKEAAPPRVAFEPVALYLDDTRVATLDKATFEARRELSAMLPTDAPAAAAWTAIRSSASGDRSQNLTRISERFPEHTPRLFIDPHSGGAALGLFEPGSSSDVVPPIHIDGLYEIRISTKPRPSMAGAKTLQLQIGNAEPSGVDDAVLAGLPTVPPSDALSKRDGVREGWELGTLLRAVAPAATPALVRLVPVDAEPVDVPADTLTRDGELLWLKRTQAGYFRFKWFRGTEPHLQLRGVKLIQLDPE